MVHAFMTGRRVDPSTRRDSRHQPRPGGVGDERGAVLVLFLLSVVMLLGMVALVLDLGDARQLRQQANAATDAAALAAARELAGSGTTASGTEVARDYVTRNGLNGATATVNIPPNRGPRAGDAGCAEVITFARARTVFARVLGIDALDVSARAVACVTRGAGSEVAVFGSSTTCQNTVDWSGSTTIVNGGVHSNNDIHIGGSTNQITGATTYQSDLNTAPGKVTFGVTPARIIDPQADPVAVSIDDYAPGGTRAQLAVAEGRYHNAGTDKIDSSWLEPYVDPVTGTLAPGLYYSENAIDISSSGIVGHNVTFVSRDQVSFSGSNIELSPWDPDGLLAFSNYQAPGGGQSSCNTFGIKMSGSSSSWAGIVYAPRSLIEMSGSTNSTLAGSLVGYAVKLNGSDLNITWSPDRGVVLDGIHLAE